MTEKTTCRYLRRNDKQCTAEAADENGEILLCTKHLGYAMQLLRRATGRTLASVGTD